MATLSDDVSSFDVLAAAVLWAWFDRWRHEDHLDALRFVFGAGPAEMFGGR